MAVGSAIGAVMAARVEMTSMPQLVAILHSFVGAAAVLVGLGGTLDPTAVHTGVEATIHQIETFVGVFVGAVTFTGSIVAFGKLQGLIGSKPLLMPGSASAQPEPARRLPVLQLAVRGRAVARARCSGPRSWPACSASIS